jgi:hypothetical protein
MAAHINRKNLPIRRQLRHNLIPTTRMKTGGMGEQDLLSARPPPLEDA